MNTTTLILPGIGNSDPSHWQSLWQLSHKNFKRVQQRDWDHPDCTEWVDVLNNSVAKIDGDIILVAHSLGCLLVSHWAAQTERQVKGALLVAPPDPIGAVFPKEAIGFSPFPMKLFDFPSIVVASSNDIYGDLDFTKSCAAAWGSHVVNIGEVGHINTRSGLGAWSEGFDFYQQVAN